MKFKRLLKYFVFAVLIVAVALLGEFSSNRNSIKKVTEVVVEFEGEDNNFLTHAMVDKLLIQNTASVKNQAKSVINLYGLENAVSKNPFVEKASVFLSITGLLKATVKQKVPVARVLLDKGSYYIDKQGEAFPLSDNFSARVLLLNGFKTRESVSEIQPLLKLILADNFLKKEIIGIEKKGDQAYQFSVRSGNYKIDFGNLSKMDIKFSKLKAFYNKAFEDKTISKYKTINVKYHNQVVCTK
ncbi:cell division protein FtsQ/DivIB [uncultured Polaribacter sp.]|uniref:cell division protein FtsQ/DivIB n=1 Tax=uncultured Polaribacter sp. TaxID=174711 RepID=UPI0026193B93|nr:cell division protein FtsQ/DivIB [uncultured Polaribacter sp.]